MKKPSGRGDNNTRARLNGGTDKLQMLDSIIRAAKKKFQDAKGSHDWDHTLRVAGLCKRIGAVEGADMDVLLSAAYLHDIGRSLQDSSNGAVCHAEKGAAMARPIINILPISDDRKKNIIHSIKSHRFRGTVAPSTIEARVLFDADKIDAIGAVGVARVFLFAGELGAKLYNPDIAVEDVKPYSIDDTGYREFKVKLCKIKDRMLTQTGMRIAIARHQVMEDFFEQFLKEYEGER